MPPAAATPITVKLYYEPTASVWEDITDFVAFEVAPITIRQGRPTEYDDVAAGLMSFALWNDDGRFMPGNTNSILYPNWGKGKRVQLLVNKGGVDYYRFIGWIQSLAPDFPSSSTTGATVAVTVTDSLGLMAQRKMRSNFTETILWRARLDGAAVDVYEAVAGSSAQAVTLVNYSTDAGAQAGSSAFLAGDTRLSAASDDDVSIGGTVSASGTQTSKVVGTFRSGCLLFFLHYKGPSSVVAGGTYYPIASFLNSGTPVCHLAVSSGGSFNSLAVRNAANTADVAGNWAVVPMDSWVRLTVESVSGSPALSKWSLLLADGATYATGNLALDIRNVTKIWIPGDRTPSCPGTWGGIAGYATRTTVDLAESFTGNANGTISARVGELAAAIAPMPVTITTFGTLTTSLATGTWLGKTSLEVLQEMVRTGGGLAWSVSGAGAAYAIGSDQTYPNAATCTIDTDGDCLGPPRLVDGTEARPTRIDAEWPGGIATARDATAEASGFSRSRRVSTVAATQASAASAAATALARASGGMRISQVEVDLMGAANDLLPVVFDEGTALGGLFPTCRYRLVVPATHFGTPTKDVHVQGWTETYSPDRISLRLDTTPAIAATLASETWTAANGTAWAGQWSATFGTAGGLSGATFDTQSNRGRIITGAGNVQAGKRLGSLWTDVEISGLLQVQGTAEAQVWWRADSGTSNGYALALSVSGGARVQQAVSGVLSTRYQIPVSLGAYGVGNYGAGAYGGALTIAAGTDYRYRIRHQGQWLSIRVWPAAATEPGTWDIDVIDTLFTGSGYVGLSQWTAGQTALFDDFLVTTGA